MVRILFPCVFILLVCFSQQEYERLKSEATALEDTIKEFRRERDSYIADIRTLEQSCKDVMRLMLESIQKYEKKLRLTFVSVAMSLTLASTIWSLI